MNPLDTLRLHPESYVLAQKIALDAMGYGEAVATGDVSTELTLQVRPARLARPTLRGSG